MAKAYHVDAAVLVDRVSFDAVVRTASGRILALEDPGAVEAGVAVERLEGALFPGFVDLQVNGAGGASVRRGGPTRLSMPWQTRLRRVVLSHSSQR